MNIYFRTIKRIYFLDNVDDELNYNSVFFKRRKIKNNQRLRFSIFSLFVNKTRKDL